MYTLNIYTLMYYTYTLMYIYIYTYVETNIYYLCDGFLLALTLREHITREGVLREHITREGVLREHITFVTAKNAPKTPQNAPKTPVFWT